MSLPEPPTDPDPERRPAAWGDVAVLGAFAVAVAVGLVYWSRLGPSDPGMRESPRPAAKAPDVSVNYLGARACARCHPREARAFETSGHRRTLVLGAETPLAHRLNGTTVADPEIPGISWSYAFRDGRFTVARSGSDGGETGEIAVDYALGSGKHATTFVSLSSGGAAPRFGLEHRLTYYANSHRLGLTPGQQDFPDARQVPFGWVLPPDMLFGCLNCHSTVTAASGRKVLDPATLIPNVSCERCHGPGREHAEKAARGATGEALAMPMGRDRAPADAEVRACAECHRLPRVLAPEEIRPDNPFLARFPSVGLMESVCYKSSPNALRCTTCHDAHEPVSTDAAAYAEVCLSCHEQPPKRPCMADSSSACVSCHMPRHDVGFGLKFTDHWVRARRGESR